MITYKTYELMLHKIGHFFEATFLVLTIYWQPIFGIIGTCIAGIYYIEMLKINVVDKKFFGSWKAYFKSKFKL